MARFDPLHKWLGIPPDKPPPHYYRLLGLRPFEDNLDVIEAAAAQRMEYVGREIEGPHRAEARELLETLTAAQVCLLQPDKKAAYDRKLQAKLPLQERQPAEKAWHVRRQPQREFDPYHAWLGIPPEEQPPDHYRLLGLESTESDPEVIETAADLRMAYVQQCATGPHTAESQKVLNELSAARVGLLRIQNGTVSDRRLPDDEHDKIDAPDARQPASAKAPSSDQDDAAADLSEVLDEPVEDAQIPTDRRDTVWHSLTARGPHYRRQIAALSRTFRPTLPPMWLVAVVLAGAVFSALIAVLETQHTGPSANGRTKIITDGESGGGRTDPDDTQADAHVDRAFISTRERSAKVAADPAEASDGTAAHPGDLPSEISNSIGMKLRLIPIGAFLMGSAAGEGYGIERPQHRVRITEPFYLGIYEVTQAEWQLVMTTGPWQGKKYVKQGGNYPATYVSWEDAMEFCRKLTERERRSGQLPDGWQYMLPSEAQWEYACRAGTTTRFSFGDDESRLGEHAWFRDNAYNVGEKYAHRVGQKRPNPWGLYDMHGNVWEWCRDWYDGGYYANSPVADPVGPSEGSVQVCRGGGWSGFARHCRSATRGSYWHLGFRVARVRFERGDARKPVNQEAGSQSDTVELASDGPIRGPEEGHERGSSESVHKKPAPAVASSDGAEEGDNLDLPSQISNSIGMKLRLIPAGAFLMGLPSDEKGRFPGERPQHRVTITEPFYLGIYEATQGQWQQVMGTGPWQGKKYVKQGGNYPATYVSWEDAMEFCRKLTERERQSDRLPDGWQYTLPTEAQWEYACRAGMTTRFSFGDDESRLGAYAWFNQNAGDVDRKYAHGVGQKQPNPWGLYDMHGNVLEWCRDWYDEQYYANSPVTDPVGPSEGSFRVYRGGCWFSFAWLCRSAERLSSFPWDRSSYLGFRVARVRFERGDARKPVNQEAGSQSDTVELASDGPIRGPEEGHERGSSESVHKKPAPAVASSDGAEEVDHLDRPSQISNSIDMKLRLIPAGAFLMGSLPDEKGRFSDEGPQHRVTITEPFYLGIHEVTQGEWQQVMGTEPWQGKKYVKHGGKYPATYVSWQDAMEFCRKLTERERQSSDRLPDGWQYTLPTEAQWEYACRAGMTTRFSFGDDESRLGEHAWFRDNAYNVAEKYAHRVGQKRPNPWGLYDMHGNVWEWCRDWYHERYYAYSLVEDPGGPSVGSNRVYRGGSCNSVARNCRSANRYRYTPDYRSGHLGFRVARVPSREQSSN